MQSKYKPFLFVLPLLLIFCLCCWGCSPSDNKVPSDEVQLTDAGPFSADDTKEAEHPAEPALEEPAQPQAPSEFSVSLGFTGDICLADNYVPMQHLAEIGSDKLSDGIDQKFLDKMNGEDLLWVNNEFVFSDRGQALDGKAWTFRGSPANVRYLKEMGADVVGLANNHTYDYGLDAFLDTLQTLDDAGIPYTGAGRDFAQASAPIYLESNGIKVAYVAASRAEYTIYTPEATEMEPGIMWCYDDAKFLEEIRTARANADYVVALPHWGTEHSTELEETQISSAHAYIDAGADAVIACHAHNLQGFEFYNGKPIAYNLGNFWFDEYDEDTVLAELHINGKTNDDGKADMGSAAVSLVLVPGVQSGAFTSYKGDDASERDRIFRHIEEISNGAVVIADDGTVAAV